MKRRGGTKTEYTYHRWGGSREKVMASHVTFEASGHVVFWDGDFIVLAERPEQVNRLFEVEN